MLIYFQILRIIGGDLYTDSIFVMPDLSAEGYIHRRYLDTLDLEHVLVTVTSIARFPAANLNYETKKSIDLKEKYNVTQEFEVIFVEGTFCDSPWMRACAKA